MDFVSQAPASMYEKILFFVRQLKPHWNKLAALIILEIVIGVLSSIIPYFTKLQIDYLESRSFFLPIVQKGLLPFFLLLLIPVVIEMIREFFFQVIQELMSKRLTADIKISTLEIVWKKLKTLDAGFFLNRRNDRIKNIAFDSLDSPLDFFEFVRRRVRSVATVVTMIPILIAIDWRLFVFVFLFTVIQLIIQEFSERKEMKYSMLEEEANDRYWRVNSLVQYDYHLLRQTGAADHFFQTYLKELRERDKAYLTHDRFRDSIRNVSRVADSTLMIIANMMVGIKVLDGSATIGTFSLTVSYTNQLKGLFSEWLDTLHDYRRMMLRLDRLWFFLGLKSRIQQVDSPIKQIQTPVEIKVDQVGFQYPDLYEEEKNYAKFMIQQLNKKLPFMNKQSWWIEDEKKLWKAILEATPTHTDVLTSTSIELKKGTLVALLGRNGAGKTTLTQLLMHGFEPTMGKILLNGKPIYAYDQEVLSQSIAYIHQTPFMMHRFSIWDNLMLGVERKVEKEEVWQLLKELHLDDVIKALPNQLDTILGEGMDLSGGQSQLIVIARSLLQKRPILIFDEGMNQLDIEKEQEVVRLLKAATQYAAVLFITHRITTAKKADHIYMLDEGQIVEEGNHQSLLKKDGLYAKFWKLQVVE